ncbi:hypothetical protein, partial [Streptomyces sp. NPDC060187]|uniref:hypothetical protein n=1 Tax=Streptomyces sp. NPDC060187 TaxID=3347067 RepID=UPI00366717E5
MRPAVVEPSSSWKCRVSWTMVPPEERTAACRWISNRAAQVQRPGRLQFLARGEPLGGQRGERGGRD